MQILFCADIHIKLGQKNVPKEWALNRLKMFIEQLLEASKEADILIIAGDVFDKLPTLEELEVYFSLISSLNIPTYIFDGNHEATRKGQTFLSMLKKPSYHINNLIQVIDTVEEYDFGTLLPYCKLKTKGVFDSINTNKPLFTHVRGEIPPHVKPEIDLNLLKPFPVVYAGDLHSHSNSQQNIVYPGSPMNTSFNREKINTGYLLIEGTSYIWKPFQLPQLLRKTVNSEDEMIATTYDHTIYELEGSLDKLSQVKNTDLLDKKIVKRHSEAALILDKSMSIEQELSEYLTYILNLEEKYVSDIIGLYRDYTKES